MEIGEAIKQKSFRSEVEKAMINLSYTYSRLQVNFSTHLKEFDLTAPQFNVLRILRGQHPKPASVKLVTERMLDLSSNVSRLMDKLVAKGLVGRRVCEHDRRQVDLLITEKGLEVVAQSTEVLNNSMDSLNIDEQDAIACNRFLDALRTQIIQNKSENTSSEA